MSDSDDNALYGSAADLTTYRRFPDDTEFSASLRSDDDHLIEYIPENRRKVGLAMILTCHFFTYTTSFACINWLPRMIVVPTGFSSNLEFLVPLVQIMFYVTGWIAGVITDSCLQKKPALLLSVVFSSLGSSSCIFLICYTYTSFTPSQEHGGAPYVFKLVPGYETLYFVMLLTVAMLATFCTVLLPTLGGDQIPTRQGVRTFYTCFYFITKVAELANFGYAWLAYRGTYDIKVTGFTLCACALFATIFVSIAALPKFTRRVNPNLSVITDGCGILVQAFKRRRMHPEDSSPLSGAATSNGGDYPDQSVKERVKMIKFAVTCLLLLPVALSVAPAAYVDYNPNSKQCGNNTDGNPPSWFDVEVAIHAAQQASTALGIMALYITCHVVQSSRRFTRPTLFSRFIAGHIIMIIGSATSLFGYYFVVCNSYYKILPYTFAGLTNALIYTTGYELTFISSPRSMQGTAMGMFYLTPGISYSISLIFRHVLPFTPHMAKVWVWITGIAGSLLGLLLLVIVHLRFDLGLSRP